MHGVVVDDALGDRAFEGAVQCHASHHSARWCVTSFPRLVFQKRLLHARVPCGETPFVGPGGRCVGDNGGIMSSSSRWRRGISRTTRTRFQCPVMNTYRAHVPPLKSGPVKVPRRRSKFPWKPRRLPVSRDVRRLTADHSLHDTNVFDRATVLVGHALGYVFVRRVAPIHQLLSQLINERPASCTVSHCDRPRVS